jgi:predicted O-methyltransferase YrrM
MDRQHCIDQAFVIPGQTWPIELMWLYDTFRTSMSHAEIGVFCGRSLFASCGAMNHSAKVVGVNDDSEYFDSTWSARVRKITYDMIHQEVTHLQTKSISAALHCHNQGIAFDSVFIDACHDYHECLADIQAWQPLIKPGGIIAGHDYWAAHLGVMDAVNETGPFEVVPNTRIWWRRV